MFFILYVIHYITRIFAIVSFVNISVREQMEDLEVLNSRGCYRFVHLKKNHFSVLYAEINLEANTTLSVRNYGDV